MEERYSVAFATKEESDRAIAAAEAYVGSAGVAVSQAFIDKAIGWGLKDPDVWEWLRSIYYRLEPVYHETNFNDVNLRIQDDDKTKWTKIPTEIPEMPPGYGARWVAVIFDVWKWYRGKLSSIRKVNIDHDKWESFVVSYITIRKVATKAKHQNISYVYAACRNAHKKLLKAQTETTSINDYEFSIRDDPDFAIDLQEALSKLPPKQALIARLRLFEDQDWIQIAESLDITDRHARRLYGEAQDFLQQRLSDYSTCN